MTTKRTLLVINASQKDYLYKNNHRQEPPQKKSKEQKYRIYSKYSTPIVPILVPRTHTRRTSKVTQILVSRTHTRRTNEMNQITTTRTHTQLSNLKNLLADPKTHTQRPNQTILLTPIKTWTQREDKTAKHKRRYKTPALRTAALEEGENTSYALTWNPTPNYKIGNTQFFLADCDVGSLSKRTCRRHTERKHTRRTSWNLQNPQKQPSLQQNPFTTQKIGIELTVRTKKLTLSNADLTKNLFQEPSLK